MTIICHAELFGISTLIADLLLTSEKVPQQQIAIPIARNVNQFIQNSGNAIVGMGQKINILSQRLAVAWSGSFKQANDIIPMLRPLAGLSDLNVGQVRHVFDAVEEKRKNKLSLIVLVVNPSNEVELMLLNVPAIKNVGPFLRVATAGTGRTAVKNVMHQLAPADGPVPNDADLAEAVALSIAAQLGGEEVQTDKPLREGWGGAFEVAQVTENGFNKLGKVLYVYFRLVRASDGFGLRWFPFFRKVDYWNDVTCVRAIKHRVTEQGLLEPGLEDIFMITQLGSEPLDATKLELPSIEDHTYVVTNVFEAPDRGTVFLHAAKWAHPLLLYQRHGAQVRVSLHRDFISDLAQRLAPALGTEPKFQGVGY
jgi:hypothetical protein